jgi:hypothetical protein
MVEPNGTELKIMEAYIRASRKNAKENELSISAVAKEAGLSRETIYHKYFPGGLVEFQDAINITICREIEEALLDYSFNSNEGKEDILFFLNKKILPLLYKRQDWLKVMFSTGFNAKWNAHLLRTFSPIVKRYLDRKGKEGSIPNFYLSQLIVREFIAVISTWITDDNAEPPVVFREKFLYILQSSIYDLLS